MFNHEYRHMPYRYPEKIIDTELFLLDSGQSDDFCRQIAFEEMDWLYILNRTTRQTGYKFDEAKAAIKKFADRYMPFLLKTDFEKDESFNDLHKLFGTLCCLAELQAALPGYIYTEKPLRLVLDRRPFI